MGQQTVAGDIQSAHHDGKLFFDHPSPEAMRSNLLPSGSRKLRAALRSWYARRWAKTTAQILFLIGKLLLLTVPGVGGGLYVSVNYNEQEDPAPENIRIWLESSDKEQKGRFEARIDDPLRQWKLSQIDLPLCKRWFDYSRACT